MRSPNPLVCSRSTAGSIAKTEKVIAAELQDLSYQHICIEKDLKGEPFRSSASAHASDTKRWYSGLDRKLPYQFSIHFVDTLSVKAAAGFLFVA